VKHPNQPDYVDYPNLTIEGNDDLSVRPWKGPSPLKLKPIDDAPANLAREQIHLLIVNDEDITVQPWRQITATTIGDQRTALDKF
jgi:hypothetical protein